MKRILIAGVAAMALLASSQAIAQTAVITVGPEQRTKIKEYVVRERIRPVTVRESVTVGATVPAEVELTAVPEVWEVPALRTHRYFYWDNRVVFVEPSSRRVVHIID